MKEALPKDLQGELRDHLSTHSVSRWCCLISTKKLYEDRVLPLKDSVAHQPFIEPQIVYIRLEDPTQTLSKSISYLPYDFGSNY